ncbi:MAG: isoprenylcysteine carboxylmethyltransferase family protein [Chloroflexota bacterium]|nr:isoprenylcysteine carboxylmethyltransferase family protein [Chloroflexota bacterium]
MSVPHVLFVASCLYWGSVEGWFALREIASMSRARDRQARIAQDRGSRFFVVIGIAAGIYAGSAIAKVSPTALPASSAVHLLLGAVVIVLGTSLRFWSILTLGRYFRATVMVQAEHHVVSSGPYRYVRHPSYSALLLNILGVGVALGNWLSLIVMLVLGGLGLALRIRVEEQVLTSSLGTEYRLYRERTKRLIPFLF